MNIHIPTLLMIQVATNLSMGLAVAYVVRGVEQRALQWWAYAMLSGGVGYVLLLVRDQVPLVLSVMAGNGMIMVMASLALVSVRVFDKRPPHLWRTVLWPQVLVQPGLLWLYDQMKWRVSLISLVLLIQYMQILVLLIHTDGGFRGRGRRLLTLSMAMICVTLAVRFAASLSGTPQLATLTTSNWVQTLTFGISYMSIILGSTGFILMSEERTKEHHRLLALEDMLTNLPNRRAILDALQRQLAQAQRSQQPVSVLMIDVDHFKQINDTQGHLVGDHVLYVLARTIQDRIRTQDLVGRLGGEEFLVILPNTALAGATQVAEDLRQTVSQTPIANNGHTLQASISIGVHSEPPGAQMAALQQLISQADAALYHAKSNGRNRVENSTALLQGAPAAPGA